MPGIIPDSGIGSGPSPAAPSAARSLPGSAEGSLVFFDVSVRFVESGSELGPPSRSFWLAELFSAASSSAVHALKHRMQAAHAAILLGFI
jgi:hypothetical protein